MRVLNLITAAVLMLLGGVVIYDALRLGVGWGSEGPQSGFFPFWLAAILTAVAFMIFLGSLRGQPGRPFVTWERFAPVLKVLGPLVGFIVLTDPPGSWPGLGLYVAAGLYLGFYMRWVGSHHWGTVVALAVAVPVLTFIVFETWFLVPMPKGPVESWLGY